MTIPQVGMHTHTYAHPYGDGHTHPHLPYRRASNDAPQSNAGPYPMSWTERCWTLALPPHSRFFDPDTADGRPRTRRIRQTSKGWREEERVGGFEEWRSRKALLCVWAGLMVE
ncbi:hypothetical protein BJ684DRAFT_17241 [Piptocephalis cylindrospora]|uniref:Uncharacterized protein n=1 Tax=Piptocephalis cylindrospora TaxID=1907219 RepID=A0A4P9Y0J9_9FUNG|nr:hypothetical protein BJ684DRAFT_17241 [Piptocephalis cylindrospora]|eukprot:RKP12258.1 hypothetical protein BJ684DRAFT_17241 [Piptocephalis cylindrospora]